MKKLLIFFMLLFLFGSCAPKISGARPHRKERNCGCEYKTEPCALDSLMTYNK